MLVAIEGEAVKHAGRRKFRLPAFARQTARDGRLDRKCRVFSFAWKIEQIAQLEVRGSNLGVNLLHVLQRSLYRDATLLAFRQQVCLQALVLPGNRTARLRASEPFPSAPMEGRTAVSISLFLGGTRGDQTLQILRQELLKRHSRPQFLDVGKDGGRAPDVLNRGIAKQGQVAMIV